MLHCLIISMAALLRGRQNAGIHCFHKKSTGHENGKGKKTSASREAGHSVCLPSPHTPLWTSG
jgi:hypothetical protein